MVIHYRLSQADALGLHLGVCRKTAAHGTIDKVCHCQRIVDHTANDPLLLPVEIKIKPRDSSNKISSLRIQAAHIFQQVRRQHDLSGDVKTDHVNSFPAQNRKRGKSCVDFPCRMGIAPVIVFRHRRTVSMALIASAHRHQFSKSGKALRILPHQTRQIRHRSQSNNGNLCLLGSLCRLFQHPGKKLYCPCPGAHFCNFGVMGFSEPVLPMSVHGIHIRADKRALLSDIDWYVHSAHLF